MNLTKKQQLVLDTINAFPDSANDDALLLSVIWLQEGFHFMNDSKGLYYALQHVTRPETISRRRRELYNMGLIKYSDKALDTRTEAFKNELDNHSDYKKAFNQMFGADDLFESFPKIRKG